MSRLAPGCASLTLAFSRRERHLPRLSGEVCETYARFGRPLHFTETTVLSGSLKAKDDNDWRKARTDWPTTAEGEAEQLDYGRKFYAHLFDSPSVPFWKRGKREAACR